jgi:ribosomal protein S18 acetylase RimI-like enzyme
MIKRASSVDSLAATLTGDTHIALNVFIHNKVAINLYDALGYNTVDEHRSTNL